MNDAIVRLIVDFAHTLGLKVTAEGVENDRQVASLTAMRCDLAQGFYFSKPLPSEAAGSSWRLILHGECLYKRSLWPRAPIFCRVEVAPLLGGSHFPTLAEIGCSRNVP